MSTDLGNILHMPASLIGPRLRVVGKVSHHGFYVGPTGNFPHVTHSLPEARFELELIPPDEVCEDFDCEAFDDMYTMFRDWDTFEIRGDVPQPPAFLNIDLQKTLRFSKAMFTPNNGLQCHFHGDCPASFWWVPTDYQQNLKDMDDLYIVHPLQSYDLDRSSIPAHLVEQTVRDRIVQIEFFKPDGVKSFFLAYSLFDWFVRP
ncbi:hypothetical protein BJ165DRAFT_1406162 [Panaeolus papilionaceus]|nr:hypothetical protein BJ165DRAFT_1406162 [Panaeolus papilionaceus]